MAATHMTGPYARDLHGYGESTPNPRWPGNARLAVSFVLNYEEGAERSIDNGDGQSEPFITETPGAPAVIRGRDVNTESAYDYGARAGVWRILRIFDRAQMPLTVFAVGQALQQNPAVGRAFARHGHEVASHHWRWIDYRNVDIETEREHVLRSIDVITQLTGHQPVGWYSGRGSLASRQLAVEAGCFIYDSDVYDDDLPHWVHVDKKPLLLIPYSLDTNDFRFALAPGYSSGADFETYLRAAFDTLYAEGSTAPKMMSVGLHCRVSGRPGRAAALQRFVDYVGQFDDVWVCRRDDIATHWRQSHPFEA